MPRHHLVPQMLLRRFADADKSIVMVSRVAPHQATRTKVRTACAEAGFYTIATDDVAPSHQPGHDPEGVEKLLAQVEGSTAPILEGINQGRFPPTLEERFRLSLLIALQITRGWRFRHDVDALGTLAARRHLAATVTEERIQRHLRQSGQPSGPKAIEQFRHRILAEGSFTLRMSQPAAVQEALRFAIEVIQPELYFRAWRLLRFEEPLLLTSDNPVGLWTPTPHGQQASHGVRTARAIYLPLDRQTALGMVLGGADITITTGPTRAHAINMAVATGAYRWVYHHPHDRPLDMSQLPPPPEFVDEVIAQRRLGGEIHELRQVSRRTNRPS